MVGMEDALGLRRWIEGGGKSRAGMESAGEQREGASCPRSPFPHEFGLRTGEGSLFSLTLIMIEFWPPDAGSEAHRAALVARKGELSRESTSHPRSGQVFR